MGFLNITAFSVLSNKENTGTKKPNQMYVSIQNEFIHVQHSEF